MRSCAVICEYNPFHNGHAYLISELRSRGYDTIVAIMSGNLVQRGDIAVCSKFARAKCALYGGADAVIELPSVYAMSHAKRFAAAGVYLAKALGCDSIGFGSECGDISRLEAIAEGLDSPELDKKIKELSKSGLSYAVARQTAYEELFGECPELKNPNDLLAIEYITAAKVLGFENFECIKRIGAAHDNEEMPSDRYASASMIRGFMEKGDIAAASKYMPAQSALVLSEQYRRGLVTKTEKLNSAVLAKLRTLSPSEISKIPSATDGLDFRIYAAIKKATTLDELLALAKSKRHTMARIKRILLSAYFGISEDSVPELPPYIRVLGMNSRGEAFLRTVKSDIPLVMRATELKGDPLFELECRITDVFVLSFDSPLPCGSEMTSGIVKI